MMGRRLAGAALLGAALLVSSLPAGAAPPVVGARAWLVESPVDGDVLAAHAETLEAPIASITKLMTVVVAVEHLKLGATVEVDARAATVGEESVGLYPGQRLTVRDLVKAALIQSANDAAAALALAVSPSFESFAVLMNAKAQSLGLTHSHFVRPDGLDAPAEYSSAGDVMRLARAAMKLPVVRDAVRRATDTTSGGIALATWNDLLATFPGVYGIKTGHTNGAGWGQVAAVRRNGADVYAVILGSPSREERNADLATLLEYGLAQYRRVDVIVPGHTYATVILPYGRSPLELVAPSAVRAAARIQGALVERVVAPVAVGLPISKGERLGTVQVTYRGRLVAQRPLVATRSVAAPGALGRTGFYARRTIHHLVSFFT